jgi:hypothetical protein
MSRKYVPIAHTGRADGVSGVRLRGDVSGAEGYIKHIVSSHSLFAISS